MNNNEIFAAFIAEQKRANDNAERFLALLEGNEPAKTAKPSTKKAKAPAKKAEPKAETTKVYRSAKGKEQAKAECEALAARWNLVVAGGTRKFKSLSAKEQAAYRAEMKAIWAAVPKTRSTKA